jgi:hypothetical protein
MSKTTMRTHRALPAVLALCALLLTLAAPGSAWASRGIQKSGGDDGGGSGSGGSGSGGSGGGGDDGGGGGGGGEDGSLKLRLNDAIGQPGGLVALVVRTYAARPLRQGRITVRVRKAPAKALGITADAVTQPARPLTFLRAVVFSRNNDAVSTARATNAVDAQSVGVDFSSRSAGINARDGPLAVLFMRLDPGVAPGSVYQVEIDPAATGLTDAAGAPLAIQPIEAELRVRAPKAPYELEAEGDEVEPGETVEMGVETKEPFAIFGGRITLRWDHAAQGGPPQVTMDPRYGKSTFRVETSTPGLLVVTFQSPNGMLNSVPGRILDVALPTNPSAPIGTRSAVTIDRAGSWLLAKKNRRLAVSFEAGEIEFR